MGREGWIFGRELYGGGVGMRKLILFLSILFLIGSVNASLPEAGMTGLLHFNWSPGTTNFTDENGAQWVTITSAGHPPYINLTVPKFGNGSAWFYGITDASSISTANSSANTWGTNHTVEFWYYPTNGTADHQTFLQKNTSAANHVVYDFYYKGSTKSIGTSVSGSSCAVWAWTDQFTTTNGVPLGQWSHIEIDWNKPTFKVYVNGILNQSLSDSDDFCVSSGNESIGMNPTQTYSTNLNGGFDEFAEWNITRHFTDFTPPTLEYGYSSPSSALTASFTPSPNPSTAGQPVTFTDTSAGTPTTWNWTIGGVTTNTTQNAAYKFSTAGTYPVNLNVTNATGRFSAVTINQIVNNATGFTPQDIWMEGRYTKTLHITDSSTNAPIPVVTVTDSNGQSYVTTNGTAYFTESFGSVVFYFAATGYVSKSMSYVIDGDSTDTVQMVGADTNWPVYNVYPPKDVKFHITSFFGTPITDATVTIQGITTSTGNWDWLVTLLGISLDEVAINGTAMSESTDSNGDAVFLMLPSVKYNITTTASGYTFPTSFIAPQATEYTITANWNESWFSSGNDTLKDVNVSVSWVKYNDTYSFVNVSYEDQTMTTTGGTITVYHDTTGRVANSTPIKTMVITGSSCTNSTLVNTPTGGASYRVLVNATTTDQNIMRTFTHYFKGAPVTLPGWTSETLLWLALFIVIFTSAFAGAIHSPQMAIVLCVESWVFWAIGWLDALITQFWYGETAIIGVLVLASFLAVVWNITEGKSKVKRSS